MFKYQAKSFTLFLVLAVIGLVVGNSLENQSRKIAEVGKNLVAAATSPDGTRIAGLALKDQEWSVRVYSPDGKLLAGPVVVAAPTGWADRLNWSQDSRQLAVADGANVLVLEFGNKVKEHRLTATWAVRQVAFRGDRLLVRSNDNVFVWDRKTWERVSHLGLQHVLHSDLSHDGTTLVAGVFQGGVQVFDLPRRKIKYSLDRDWTAAYLKLSACDQKLVVSYRFRNQRHQDHSAAYRVKDGKLSSQRLFHRDLLTAAVSESGHRLITRSEKSVVVWELESNAKVTELDLSQFGQDSISADGKLVASSLRTGQQVRLWSADNGRVVTELEHRAATTFVDFTSNRRLDVTGDTCAVWDLSSSL